MEVVEQQLREGTYGGLKAREARLKERHDAHISGKEADEIRRLAQLKLAEKVHLAIPEQLPVCAPSSCLLALGRLYVDFTAMLWKCAVSTGFCKV